MEDYKVLRFLEEVLRLDGKTGSDREFWDEL